MMEKHMDEKETGFMKGFGGIVLNNYQHHVEV